MRKNVHVAFLFSVGMPTRPGVWDPAGNILAPVGIDYDGCNIRQSARFRHSQGIDACF